MVAGFLSNIRNLCPHRLQQCTGRQKGFCRIVTLQYIKIPDFHASYDDLKCHPSE